MLNYMTMPKRKEGKIHNIPDWDSKELKNRTGGLLWWFAGKQGNEQRSKLCGGLKRWLLELKLFRIPMDILIGGLFVTLDPKPGHVDVTCIIKMNLDKMKTLDKKRIDNLLNNGGNILNTYSVSVVEVCSSSTFGGSDEVLYNEAIMRFGFNKKDNATIFRVCL